jgi:ketosteroid isomerase-like protein
MSNVDSAKAAYEAFGGGDMETLKGMFSEDAVWQSSDELPAGGEIHGPDAIIAGFGEIPKYWTSFSVTPEEFIDAGEWVAVRGTQAAGNDKGSFEAPFAHLMQFRDGKLVRGEFYGDSAKAAKLLG